MAAKKKSKKETKENKGKEEVKEVQEIADSLFSLLKVKASVSVSEDKENDAILVNIDSEDAAGLLIGNRGETLNSIQTVIGMIYGKQKGEWKRILVDVADWREKQKARLTQLAEQTAEKVKSSGQPQPLYNLSAAQRRLVHLSLVEDGEIKTESVGEGRDRYLVIAPKNSEKNKQD